jgi:hypothetical protein
MKAQKNPAWNLKSSIKECFFLLKLLGFSLNKLKIQPYIFFLKLDNYIESPIFDILFFVLPLLFQKLHFTY